MGLIDELSREPAFPGTDGLVTAFSTVSGLAVAQDEVFARKALSTIGIIAPEQAPIDYQERAPLVVPPKFALPPPQERLAGRGGAWPTDPNLRPETPEQIAEEKAEIEARGAGEDGTHVPTVVGANAAVPPVRTRALRVL